MPNNNDLSIILPGLKPVLEILEKNPERVAQVYLRKGRVAGDFARILDFCRERGVYFKLIPDEALQRMVGKAHSQGVVARLRQGLQIEWQDLLEQGFAAPLPLIVALDQVQDPGNIGTLARTLYALGGAGFVVTKHNSSWLGPGAMRSSMGALELLPVAEVTNMGVAIQDAKLAGYSTYAAMSVIGSVNPLREKLNMPAVLVLGNEDKGIRPGVVKHCESKLGIQLMRDFDSLNVAQAGAILISCFLNNFSGVL